MNTKQLRLKKLGWRFNNLFARTFLVFMTNNKSFFETLNITNFFTSNWAPWWEDHNAMSSFWIIGLDQPELILQDSLIFGVCCLLFVSNELKWRKIYVNLDFPIKLRVKSSQSNQTNYIHRKLSLILNEPTFQKK